LRRRSYRIATAAGESDVLSIFDGKAEAQLNLDGTACMSIVWRKTHTAIVWPNGYTAKGNPLAVYDANGKRVWQPCRARDGRTRDRPIRQSLATTVPRSGYRRLVDGQGGQDEKPHHGPNQAREDQHGEEGSARHIGDSCMLNRKVRQEPARSRGEWI
jgi:hypothetical protein